MVTRSVQAPRLLRAVGAGSALYGTLLLAVPRTAVAAVGGGLTPPPSLVVRVLGARQVGQGLALLLRPAKATVVASAAVDGLHALTMVAAAVRWPGYRRAAVASGAVAIASGVLVTVTVR
jgi:hypothetical protein